jgi:RNA polymerase sigma factor (sigma-70 family)
VIEGVAPGIASPMGQERETEASKWADGAFEELYVGNYTRIVGVLLRLLGDRARAEELANDVFWRLYRQGMLPNPGGNVAGWLYRTATNLGIDVLRASARRKRYEDAAGRVGPEQTAPLDPLDGLLLAERRARVRAVLARLKPAQAQILVLRASGCSYQELAEVLGVKRGSVGTMLARAETEFQKNYREAYGREEEL